MTIKEANEILLKHKVFFEIYKKDKYVPRAQEPALAEITSALKVINPNFFKGQSGCQDCGMLLIHEAIRRRDEYLKTKPKNYKF